MNARNFGKRTPSLASFKAETAPHLQIIVESNFAVFSLDTSQPGQCKWAERCEVNLGVYGRSLIGVFVSQHFAYLGQ